MTNTRRMVDKKVAELITFIGRYNSAKGNLTEGELVMIFDELKRMNVYRLFKILYRPTYQKIDETNYEQKWQKLLIEKGIL